MEQITELELTSLGRIAGVAEKEFTPPFPGAKPMLQQVWETENVARAVEYLRETYKPRGGKVSILGHVDSWICMAFADALQPECEVFFKVPNHDPDNTFTDIPVYPVKYGEPDDSLKFTYSIREDGDIIYMDYGIDNDLDWLYLVTEAVSDLTIPALPEDRILCLHSLSHYPLQWVAVNNYAKTARSIFCSDHDDPFYHCAIPGNSGYKLGDTIPRIAG